MDLVQNIVCKYQETSIIEAPSKSLADPDKKSVADPVTSVYRLNAIALWVLVFLSRSKHNIDEDEDVIEILNMGE